MSDWPRGSRWMQTFRKLPTARPSSDENRELRRRRESLQPPGLLRHRKERRLLRRRCTRPVAGSMHVRRAQSDRPARRSEHAARRSARSTSTARPAAGGNRAIDRFELVDLIERVRAAAASARRCAAATVPRTCAICCHRKRAAARSLPRVSIDAASGVEPVRRIRLRGGALEPVRRRLVVVQPPVIDEADVVEVLPLVRHRRDALASSATA